MSRQAVELQKSLRLREVKNGERNQKSFNMFTNLVPFDLIWPQITGDVGMCFIFCMLISLSPCCDYYSVDALFGTRTKVCIIYARPSSILKNGPCLFLCF